MIKLASIKATDEAMSPMKDAVRSIATMVNSDRFNMDPVIRPVVDLSNVQKGVKDIASLMNRTYSLSSVYNNAMETASSFTKSRPTTTEEETSSATSTGVNEYNFVQNNYSPKALTRSEIYRQTNNQFAAFRKAVNPT